MGLGHFCFEDKLYKLNKKKKSLTRKYFKLSGQWEKSEEYNKQKRFIKERRVKVET